jgi:hypothetical protein
MKWKIAALVLMGLLVGLGIGYAVAYLAYVPDLQREYQDFTAHLALVQDQLQNLTSQLSGIDSTLSALQSLQSNVSEIDSKLSTLAPPWSKTVLYAEYNLSWGKIPNTQDLLSGGGKLHVGDYSSIAVFLEFENITSEHKGNWLIDAMWTVAATWSHEFSSSVSYELLPFTVVDVPIPSIGVATSLYLGVYSVKAPYVELWPQLINYADSQNEDGYNATAMCKIYVYLTRSTQATSDLALDAHDWAMAHTATVTTNMGFGPYLVRGYSEINVALRSNVSFVFTAYNPMISGGYTYESNVYVPANTVVQRTYQVQSPYIAITCSNPSATPWQVIITFYVKP